MHCVNHCVCVCEEGPLVAAQSIKQNVLNIIQMHRLILEIYSTESSTTKLIHFKYFTRMEIKSMGNKRQMIKIEKPCRDIAIRLTRARKIRNIKIYVELEMNFAIKINPRKRNNKRYQNVEMNPYIRVDTVYL